MSNRGSPDVVVVGSVAFDSVQTPKAAGIWTVALCGGRGGRLAGLADVALCVGSTRITARIQEGHAMIIHALCELIEELLADG